MRASTAVSALLATVLATTLALGAQAGSETPARSVEKTFLIPSSEGYGVADCLTTPAAPAARRWPIPGARPKGSPPPAPSASRRRRSIPARSTCRSRSPPSARCASPAGTERRYRRKSPHFCEASVPQGISGTAEVEFFGEPWMTLSE